MAAEVKRKRELEEARKKEEEEEAAREAEAAAAAAAAAVDVGGGDNGDQQAEINDRDKDNGEPPDDNTAAASQAATSSLTPVDTPGNSEEANSDSKSTSDIEHSSSNLKEIDPVAVKRRNLFSGCVQTVIASSTFKQPAQKAEDNEQETVKEEIPEDQNSAETKSIEENEVIVSTAPEDEEHHIATQFSSGIPDISFEEPDNDDDRNDASDENNTHNVSDISHEDESDIECGPAPLALTLKDIIYLPPPDFADVKKHEPSPSPSPLPSPRGRRPTIVGIGGLAVSPTEEDKSYAAAINFLQEDMYKGDNEVPPRPHRRHSHSVPVDEDTVMKSVQDVEDYNNRLVFKLPPRRKSSATYDSAVEEFNNRLAAKNSSTSKVLGTSESDEGIDLAEEEFIEQTYVIPYAAATPVATLRISLPNDQDANADICEGPASKSGSHIGLRRPSSTDMSTPRIGLMPETPRSMSRSEFSGLSIVSPRTICQISDDEDEPPDGNNNADVYTEEMKDQACVEDALPSYRTATDSSIKSECDADSVWLTMGSDAESLREIMSAANHFKSLEDINSKDANLSNDDSCHDKGGDTNRSTRKKITKKVLKRSLSCQRIELKELSLNNPVTVDQYSNRHKIGMIPRNVSKFLVLGKSPPMELARKSDTTRISFRDRPEVLSPTVQRKPLQRPQTAGMTPRERDVLHNRRISLMGGQGLPLLDDKRNFDLPEYCDKIEVPTGNEPSTSDLLDRMKTMERKILKRSKTSMEFTSVHGLDESLFPANYRRISTSSEKTRLDRPLSARQFSSLEKPKLSSSDPHISVVDLSKSLRKANACKSAASLSTKKHTGFKSIVPLARVVMAYQNVKKRRSQTGFYSISRQLEKSGVPFQSRSRPTSPRKNTYEPGNSSRGEKKRKSKLLRKRSNSMDGLDSLLDPRCENDITTLVGDLKDPDIIPQHVVFEKVRPLTAHANLGSNSRNVYPLTGRTSSTVQQSKIMTLEIPDANKLQKKVKNVSLLSKLPIK